MDCLPTTQPSLTLNLIPWKTRCKDTAFRAKMQIFVRKTCFIAYFSHFLLYQCGIWHKKSPCFSKSIWLSILKNVPFHRAIIEGISKECRSYDIELSFWIVACVRKLSKLTKSISLVKYYLQSLVSTIICFKKIILKYDMFLSYFSRFYSKYLNKWISIFQISKLSLTAYF